MKRILIYLGLGAFCASSVGAFLWVIIMSLRTNAEFMTKGPWAFPKVLQLGNYIDAWQMAKVGKYFFNSVFLTAAAVSLGVMAATMAAYVIARIEFRWNRAVLQLFLVSMMVPGMLTLVPLYFWVRKLGLYDTRIGLILLFATGMLAFDILILTGFFKTLPAELEEAAALDGATPFQTFWRIMVPLSTPGIATVGVLNMLGVWNDFMTVLIFVDDKELYTLPVGLNSLAVAAERGADWVVLFAGIVISIIPVLILFGLLQEQIAKGLTSGALKG